MPEFVRNTAIAITWNASSCQLLKLQHSGEKLEVAATWSGQVSKDRPLSELIAEGVKSLSSDDSIFLVAGGDGTGWGLAEVQVPLLKAEELKRALYFELRKITPLPPDKLQWGYRCLPQTPQASSQKIALLYVKRDRLDKWHSALAALHYVDCLLPPAAALTPVFSGYSLLLPVQDGHYYRYTEVNGQWQPAPEDCSEPPSLADALPAELFNFGPLAQLPRTEQQLWISALILGAYALTPEASRDSATLLPLPQHLRPHRNQSWKFLALGLATYILLLLIIGIGRHLQVMNSHLRKIDSEMRKVQASLTELNKLNTPADQTMAAALRQELQDNLQQGPDFPDVLAELSRIIQPPAWISQRLEWNSGLITFQLVSSVKDLDLAGKLEDSPLLGDVREQSSSFNQNLYTTKFSLNAREDTPEEAAALQERQKAAAAKDAASEEEEEMPEPEESALSSPDDSQAADEP